MSVCSISLSRDPWSPTSPPGRDHCLVWAAEMSQFSKDLLFPAPSNLMHQGWVQPPAMSRSSTMVLVLSRRVKHLWEGGSHTILMLLSSPCHWAHLFWLLFRKSKCDLILHKSICVGKMWNEITQHEHLHKALPLVTLPCTELGMKSALKD